MPMVVKNERQREQPHEEVRDVSLEGRKVIGIRENVSRQRVPKLRSSGKETVAVPLNTRVAQLKTEESNDYENIDTEKQS